MSNDPYSDAYYRPIWTQPAPAAPTVHPRIAWADGRVYRHTDGVLCGAGQNQVGARYEGGQPLPYGELTPMVEILTCLTHGEDIVLAPRYRHEEDPDGDCEATPDQITRYPGEATLCTLHELPVVEVW